MKSTHFSTFPQAEFDETIKVKWAASTELSIVNESWYFEKAQTQKTDCEVEDGDE